MQLSPWLVFEYLMFTGGEVRCLVTMSGLAYTEAQLCRDHHRCTAPLRAQISNVAVSSSSLGQSLQLTTNPDSLDFGY